MNRLLKLKWDLKRMSYNFHIRIEMRCQDLWRLLLAKVTLNPLYVSCTRQGVFFKKKGDVHEKLQLPVTSG